MTLFTGYRLGHYAIVAPLGAGGMGEVYRARDTKLNREVAIKILPADVAQDSERLLRFKREAQLLASLNHPNIAAIYGLDEADDKPFLVLELVEGEELALRLKRGAIPLDEATEIARQIALALEEAHEKGIVHRDLKPANVKLTPDGKVKVLDFGLAKAYGSDVSGIDARDSGNSPTMTHAATMAGMILGTAAYMSPEQARGRSVDKRADIWAFGVLLHEMLTGTQLFHGETVSDTLAAVLTRELDVNALPTGTPAAVRRLLRRCLEKDPRRRLSSIGDARLELDENESGVTDAASASPTGRRSIGLPLVVAIAAVAILATAVVMRALLPASVSTGSGGVAHLSIVLPEGDEIAETSRLPLALSPDGTLLVYVGRHDGKLQLHLRKLAEGDPVPIAGTEGAIAPFFSPDGQWIAFFADRQLKKIAVGGAGLQVICDCAPDPRGGSWGADGNIYFAPTNISGLSKVPASGGAATELTRTDHGKGEISHRWPSVLPDRRTLLFTIWTGPGADERQIVVQSLATGERHVLVSGGDTAHYLSSGYLLYARLDNLLAVPWRPPQTDVGGAVPVSFPEHPRQENEGAAAYAVADNGTLVYLPGGAARYAKRVLWVDRAGRSEALPVPERDYESVAISPDGQQAFLQVIAGTTSLWVYDFARRTFTPFVTPGGSSQAPVFTPDGRRIIYRATRHGLRNIYWKAADGTGDEEALTTRENVTQSPNSVSPDGQWLLFHELGGPASGDGVIWKLRLSGDRTPQPAIQASGRVLDGRVSPDGNWLAYMSGVSGLLEVYVQPFPGPGPSREVSNGGGTEPLWSRDGRELFYLSGDKLMAVDVVSSSTRATGQPHMLFEGRFRPNVNGNTAYDVSADGLRFLRIQQVQPDRPVNHVDAVLNWGDELKRLAATK